MSTTITRAPPCLTIHIPSSKHRPSPTPAFGVISTYSHRIPRSRPSHSHSTKKKELESRDSLETTTSEEDLDDPFELGEVTVAQVSKPLPPSSRHTPVHEITLGTKPPTPSDYPSIEEPVVYRKTPRDSSLHDRSIKQQRRTASIYSVSSELPHLNPTRPSSTSLSHTGTISSESLYHPPTSLSSNDTLSSRTIRPSAPRPFLNPPIYSTATRRVVPPDQTAAAERLKRLYLCPWESKSPPRASPPRASIAQRPNHTTVVIGSQETEAGVGRKLSLKGKLTGSRTSSRIKEVVEKEKALPVATIEGSTVVDDGGVVEEERRKWRRERNFYFLKLTVLTLLCLALMIDLVVLNVKIFAREDWE